MISDNPLGAGDLRDAANALRSASTATVPEPHSFVIFGMGVCISLLGAAHKRLPVAAVLRIGWILPLGATDAIRRRCAAARTYSLRRFLLDAVSATLGDRLPARRC